MRNIVFLFLIIFSSCGKESTTEKNSTMTSGLLSQQEAESLYKSFPGPDQSLSINNLIGSTLTERKQGTTFCRRSGAVVPNPVYSYECWKMLNSGSVAQSSYQAITSSEYNLIRVGLYGAGTVEKVNSDRSLLCQVSTGVSPGAVGTYTCYLRI